jgi:hypothetical protein
MDAAMAIRRRYNPVCGEHPDALRATARCLVWAESLVLLFTFCVVAGVLTFQQVAHEMLDGDIQQTVAVA